jgi:hypothetical protein
MSVTRIDVAFKKRLRAKCVHNACTPLAALHSLHDLDDAEWCAHYIDGPGYPWPLEESWRYLRPRTAQLHRAGRPIQRSCLAPLDRQEGSRIAEEEEPPSASSYTKGEWRTVVRDLVALLL